MAVCLATSSGELRAAPRGGPSFRIPCSSLVARRSRRSGAHLLILSSWREVGDEQRGATLIFGLGRTRARHW
jgi:hypothetical protein